MSKASSQGLDARSAALWGALALVTLSFIICTPALLLPRGVMRRVINGHVRAGMTAARVICNLDCEIRGGERIRGRPVLIASKHQSAFETFALQWCLSDPAIILKRELLAVPFYGWAIRKLGHIPVDRSGDLAAFRDVINLAQQRLADGRPAVIFPEGTRQPVGAPPHYQAGTYVLYRMLNVPCVPVALNSGQFWPVKGLRFRPGRIVISFLPELRPASGEMNSFPRWKAALKRQVRNFWLILRGHSRGTDIRKTMDSNGVSRLVPNKT